MASSAPPHDDVEWFDDRVARTVYSTDNSIYQVEPERIAVPASVESLARALRDNAASPHPRPVVARGAGTGTNGQSLTDGIVVDLKRAMNRIRSIDPISRTAVVEPGVVTAALNAELAVHGLFWPPHTSTLNRATVGGMISTDAAGKGSLIHGRTHRHVERLDLLLADGTSWVAEPVTEAEAGSRASRGGRGGELWQQLLELPVDELGDLGLPELARGFSGYGIDRLRRDGMVDPVALLCGAEGTLGIITSATLRLTPLPSITRMVVATYPTFDDALHDAVELRTTGPAAIECFDETTLERGRSSPAWPALGAAIGDDRAAVLVLEYVDEAAENVDRAVETITATGRSSSTAVVDDAGDRADVWKVRADAVGLLAKVATGGPDLSARPTAFVEDCAVPVDRLPAFIADFRAVLDDAGLVYAMFGHADVGCVHVRPALDLTDPAHRALVAEITARVTALIIGHGGLVWGEHGRGFRGAHVTQVLPAATIDLMRRVKSAFDPRDLLNPGKLYRPVGSDLPLLEVTDPSLRGQHDTEVPVEVRRRFADAFACNGNGLCHHYAAAEVMCPSYKATGDPALSPKGRADLLRAWLRDRGESSDFEAAIAANLHQCLSCSACAGHCPVEVDIPELKSRFLHEYHSHHRRPVAHYLLGRFEELAHGAARMPWLSGPAMRPMSHLLGLVDLPTPGPMRRTTADRFDPRRTEPGSYDIVVMPDVFTSAIENETLHAAVAVLELVGYRVAVAPFFPSGKFDHVKGRRSRFAAAARRQRRLVAAIDAAGAIAVVVEPAVALLHGHEYVRIDPLYPSSVVRPLSQVIADRSERLPDAGNGRAVTLLGHCTERTTAPASASAWASVLRAAGYVVTSPDVGCCGMAGIFGHEAANQQMSNDLWVRSWEASMSSPDVAAPGYSCRSQAERHGHGHVRHPVHFLLQERQRIGPSGPVGEADKERKNQPGGIWARTFPRGLQEPTLE